MVTSTIQYLLGYHDLHTTRCHADVMGATAQQQYDAVIARIEQSLSLAPVSLTALTFALLPDRAPTALAAVTKVRLDDSL